MNRMIALTTAAMTGLILPAGALAAPDDVARIVVTGVASVRTPPDLAFITFTVRGEGATADDAVTALTTKRKAIESALGAIRGTAAATTSEVAVQEVRGRECQGYQPQLSVGACAVLGYRATMSLELRTGAVKDAGTIVGLIGRAGGSDPRVASFRLGDDGSARTQAVAKAFAEARSQAEALAAAGRVKLGRLLSASDGSGGYRPEMNGDIVVTATAPPPPPPPQAPIAVSLTPRPIDTQARVTLAFEVLP